jgi:hypothetical protein
LHTLAGHVGSWCTCRLGISNPEVLVASIDAFDTTHKAASNPMYRQQCFLNHCASSLLLLLLLLLPAPAPALLLLLLLSLLLSAMIPPSPCPSLPPGHMATTVAMTSALSSTTS